jgi:hypothetical protein
MKIKNLKYVPALMLSLALFSCEDFLNINDNPNALPEEKASPDRILPGAMVNAYRVQSRTMNNLGNIYMQNWGADVNNFTAANIDEYSLAISNTFYAGIWDGLYPQIYQFHRILDFPSDNYDNHKAVALIMKSFYMQYIVDIYGDAPYSEAFQGQDNVTPAYDDDALIYRDLITNLDTAIEMFYNTDADDMPMGATDVVFGGNIGEWVKFANTLKVRILLRQSGLAGSAEMDQYLTDEFAKVADTGVFLTQSATINPGYSNAVTAQMNPFYSIFKTTSGNDTQTYLFTRATAYISDFLNGDENGVIDPRRGRLYTLVGGEVVGAVQGALNGPAVMSQVGAGLIQSASQDGYVMTLSEAKFLLAEAIHRGYLTGNAQGEFEAGIADSFARLGNTAGELAGYLVAIDGVDGLGWNGSADKIEAIMVQKWLAVNGVNAIESWIDYTRTGYPEVPLATIAQYPNRPYRLLYPASELIANSANVPDLPLSQIFVQGPFWKN